MYKAFVWLLRMMCATDNRLVATIVIALSFNRPMPGNAKIEVASVKQCSI